MRQHRDVRARFLGRSVHPRRQSVGRRPVLRERHVCLPSAGHEARPVPNRRRGGDVRSQVCPVGWGAEMPQHGRSVLANIDRLNACMDKSGLAAVAVRTGVNFTYLSGMAMPGTLSRHLDIANTVRGFMVLWPRHGAPVIVLDAFAEKLARRESWIAQVEVYQAYESSLYGRVAELIADAGLATARIGFEQDGLSASHWDE